MKRVGFSCLANYIKRLQIMNRDQFIFPTKRYEFAIQADNPTRTTFHSRNFIKESKGISIFFLWICMFFHFNRIKSTVFFNQKVYFVPVFVPIEIERKIKNTLVVIAFYYFRNNKALKKCACHCTVFLNIRGIPLCQIRSKSRVKEVQLWCLNGPFCDIVVV